MEFSKYGFLPEITAEEFYCDDEMRWRIIDFDNNDMGEYYTILISADRNYMAYSREV